MTVYLEGYQSGDSIIVSLESSAILFLINSSETFHINITFVDTGKSQGRVILPLTTVTDIPHDFTSQNKVCNVVSSCSLPVEYSGGHVVRSGLCCIMRFLVLAMHKENQHSQVKDILGFRGGCLRACSEVSSWTKLCEVEVPRAIRSFLSSQLLQKTKELPLPREIVKLDKHLRNDVVVHNANKIRGKIVAALKERVHTVKNTALPTSLSDPDIIAIVTKGVYLPGRPLHFRIMKDYTSEIGESKRIYESIIHVTAHSRSSTSCESTQTSDNLTGYSDFTCLCSDTTNRRCLYETSKIMMQTLPNIDNVIHTADNNISVSQSKSALHFTNEVPHTVKSELWSSNRGQGRKSGETSDQPCGHEGHGGIERVETFINSLTVDDIHLEHMFMEGTELTLSDIVLFVFVYHFMHHLQSQASQLSVFCPHLCVWYEHLASLPLIEKTSYHLDVPSTLQALHGGLDKSDFLTWPHSVDADDVNIQRIVTTRYHAIQPDITGALLKIKESGIEAEVSDHPCRGKTALDWENLPRELHPVEGHVPPERAKRKYEQIESLVSAIVEIAKPGDVIVDFCSGGGHLGIVVAYLLQECQVYLVENKEESLMYAESRIHKLRLPNVTLFQCNLEYFRGHFDIGCCLHACGVASDMVQLSCLNSRASFVICPCCYGSVQNTHLITYPRSGRYRNSGLCLKDCLTLAHAADMTEVGTRKEQTGKTCMNLIDWDRVELGRECGYAVALTSLQPLTCTPKNNLIIATPNAP